MWLSKIIFILAQLAFIFSNFILSMNLFFYVCLEKLWAFYYLLYMNGVSYGIQKWDTRRPTNSYLDRYIFTFPEAVRLPPGP